MSHYARVLRIAAGGDRKPLIDMLRRQIPMTPFDLELLADYLDRPRKLAPIKLPKGGQRKSLVQWRLENMTFIVAAERYDRVSAYLRQRGRRGGRATMWGTEELLNRAIARRYQLAEEDLWNWRHQSQDKRK